MLFKIAFIFVLLVLVCIIALLIALEDEKYQRDLIEEELRERHRAAAATRNHR